jgi:hypothetical protein
MKINEILVESQQLDEGPLLNKIGTGIGKVAGGVGKAVGAVAGGIAGLGSAIKKGYQAGKSTVATGGDDAETDTAEPAATTKPAAGSAGAPTAGSTAATKKPAAGGAAAPAAGGAADNAEPTAGGAAAPTTPATTKKPAAGGAKPAAGSAGATAPAADNAAPAAGGTVYAQVKANIDKLDKKGKQRILQALQKEVGTAPAAAEKPAAGGATPADAGAGAMGQMAGQLAKGGATKPNTMANTPVSKTNTAKPGNPNAAAPDTAAAPATAPAAEPAAPEKAAPGATTTTPSGEKVLANPVATVGTKRATNIGQQTFDTQTGKALPGQSINAIRKKAEYGTGALGAARKRNKAKAEAPAAQESIDADRRKIMGTSTPTKVREKVSESFSLFRKR